MGLAWVITLDSALPGRIIGSHIAQCNDALQRRCAVKVHGNAMAAHDDHHRHEHGSELSEMQLRVRALETILTEKGYVDPAALDRIIETYETKVGPHNGARVVARAWSDPAFKQALLEDAHRGGRARMGHVSRVGDHLVAVENTPQRHNMVVCTLCSCYPWEVLGLPPVWYKSAPYRSRAVKDPRGVLADFGVTLPRRPRSASGIRPPRRASWCCRCVPPAPRAGARSGLPISSPAIA